MADTKKAGAQTARRGSKASRFATWFGLLMLTTVFMPTSLVLAAALLPTIFAFLFDRTHGKSFTLTIGMLNLTATVPSLIKLWSTTHSISTANEILADPAVWLTTLGASGVGWLVFLAMPPIIKAYYDIVTVTRIRTLQERQAKLREDWGDDVTENADVSLIEHNPVG